MFRALSGVAPDHNVYVCAGLNTYIFAEQTYTISIVYPSNLGECNITKCKLEPTKR